MSSQAVSRLAEVDRLAEQFADLPPESVFKEDLLRIGISFTGRALEVCARYKPKSYFIFSFDRQPIAEMENAEHLRAPEEIALVGGPRSFRRTIVSVRLNASSPYVVDLAPSSPPRDSDGDGDSSGSEGLVLLVDGEPVCRVELQESPSYYRHALADGKPITEVAPTIEWGYLVYLTVYRKCQYFGFKEECRFCDINENFRQQRAAGQPYTTVKEVEDILAALEIIDREDTERRSQAYTITGGSITRHLRGLDEVQFYARYARAINERFPGRWISKMVVQALPKEALIGFRDAGVQIYHPNYEVWDRKLFAEICPGKEDYVGHGEWMRRILDSAEIFGPSCVIPNFVAGVEMAKPHGFDTVQAALASTGEGLDFFMSRGITPRFTTWCPEPLSVLGKDEGPAPLEYHVGLLRLWRDTLLRHELPAPPGYGPPGVGEAVFSVSGFMDAVPVGHPVAELG